MKRARSNSLTRASMKSKQSMDDPPKLRRPERSTVPGLAKKKRSESPDPSCVSMKSDRSIDQPIYFRGGASSADPRSRRSSTQRKHQQRDELEGIFQGLETEAFAQLKKELERFKRTLTPDYPACSAMEGEEEEEEEEDRSGIREGALQIAMQILKNKKQTVLADTLQSKLISVHQQNLKSMLKSKCKRINEGILEPGSSALLNEVYTELYITEGWSGEISNEHEVRQMESTFRRTAAQEKAIKCNELFKDRSIRTVLTKGVAGIGKTVSVQKFILDWAEGKASQDVMLVFPLPFRELNLMRQKQLSLMNLLHQFFPQIKNLDSINCDVYKVVFVFDGLDECRLPLNFQSNQRLCDVTQPASVDVLLTNLIKGNLFPSAFLWITSRPGAASRISPVCVDQVTEVRGFSDPQKEEYFRMRINDPNLANQIISHIKSSRSLYIMCQIPVFCWILASVLERMLGEAEGGEIPKTLTQMFTHFLIFQIKHESHKYQCKHDHDPQKCRDSIMALGKLAFQQLEKGNLIFYEEDLRECGLDVNDPSVFSGVCTQIFREEFRLHLGKVFSFVHLSVQEFLAALFAFLSFTNENATEQPTDGLSDLFGKSSMTEFLRGAVDKALESKNGHLDLFLRFLLGLSLESNQTLLRGLLPLTGRSSRSTEETARYVKEKIRENPSPEKSINMFHCLNELNDHALVQEVQDYLKRGNDFCLYRVSLSQDQWSALVFVLLNTEQELDLFDLKKFHPSEQCLLKLLPVVKASRKVELQTFSLTGESCAALSSVLRSSSSRLRDLDLSNNKLQDSGVKLLCDGLKDPHCNLEVLSLRMCELTEESCAALSSVLSSGSSSLKNLDLSYNKLRDSGVKWLCAGLKHPRCTLERLRLHECDATEESCAALSSVLSSHSSVIKNLDLSHNKLQDSGVKRLCDGLKDQRCNLEVLRLSYCSISAEGCDALASALRSNPSSHLRKLALVNNNPGKSGGRLLFDLQKDPKYKLEKLYFTPKELEDESDIQQYQERPESV